MADEIAVQGTMRVSNGAYSDYATFSYTLDQAGVGGGNPGVVDIGTADEPIDFGDLNNTKGLTYFTNLDPDNYVDFGPEANGTIVVAWRIPPASTALLKLIPDVTYRGRANTAACRVLINSYAA